MRRRASGVVEPTPPVMANLETIVTTSQPVVNNMKGYGFVAGSLNSFISANQDNPRARSENYEAAQYLFFGLMDMERGDGIGIPHQLYQAMNTREIAAMLIGAYKLKKLGVVELHHRQISYDELIQQQPPEIISALVAIGFQYSAIRRMTKGFNAHPTRGGDLRKRIAQFGGEVGNKFISLLKRARAISNSERSHASDFYDPNIDAQVRGYSNAKIYTRHVIENMQAIYLRNTRANLTH